MTLTPDPTSNSSLLKRATAFMGMYWAALLQFWVLVLCVESYSSKMEIFPCRRYKMLLSTVPCTRKCFVSILSFERSFSVKRQHISCAAPMPCLTLHPFRIFLKNWERVTWIQSEFSAIISTLTLATKSVLKLQDHVSLVSGCNTYPFRSTPQKWGNRN